MLRGSSLNLLIFEYISGGGYSGQKLSSSILSEAYGMLRCLISDCKTAGHNVTTLMDSRLITFNAPIEANSIAAVHSRNEVYEKLKDVSSLFDGVYIIAPESGQVLGKLLKTVEDSGGKSLNCESASVKLVSNKMQAYQIFEKSGLRVPETLFIDTDEKVANIRDLVKDLGYPLVVKPLDGVSCGGLSVINDEEEMASAVKKVIQESTSKQFVVQKLIKGKAASACVFSTGEKARAISLNKQHVILSSPNGESSYSGGVVPFNHSKQKGPLEAAKRAVEAVKGLKGYVGVDMILTYGEPVVIEVNPRLTASYIGLSRVSNVNTAEAIIDAVNKRKMPKDIQIRGYSFFSKVVVPSNPVASNKTYNLKDVITPPFPVEEKEAYALISSYSRTVRGAQSAFYRNKRQLLSLYKGV
jgi:predicted ATP-grasp superfamily ATP-dependent carboligase